MITSALLLLIVIGQCAGLSRLRYRGKRRMTHGWHRRPAFALAVRA